MSDMHLHHEGHEHPNQDWQGGLSPAGKAEIEAAYREIMAEEERQKKLAKLGESVLGMLHGRDKPNTRLEEEALDVFLDALRTARHLALLPIEDCEPTKPDHASQERASFEREALERYMGGE